MLIRCYDCGETQDDRAYSCMCGGLLEVVQDFKGLDAEELKMRFRHRLSERMSPYASGVWRYKELIHPELPDGEIVTKREGNTGLYAPEVVRRSLGIRKVWLKAQSENPSGSFKDNGMTVAVSHGRYRGYRRFTCTSTGNTSSSLAMYAAWAECESVVLVPNERVSINKVLQTLAYGAKVVGFDGTYDEGIRFYERYGSELGLYICNSINPFRIEGQKSIVYEIAQSLDWELPDWIVIPGGALSNVTALGKGLEDLFQLGLIERMPRVALIQAEGASPFHRMMSLGEQQLTAFESPSTIASAMNIGNPPSWKKARDFLTRHGGVTCSVTDEEIMAAKTLIDRSGIGCEPASAATVAGLRKLLADKTIDREETAACILTGNLLKDTEALKHTYRSELSEWDRGGLAMPMKLTPERVLGRLGSADAFNPIS
ncbi:threonine synthase [Cohnella endophytica]|uniref:Threonine synthase n=1 Tax=Cohnella endophytica TaxID=2419778 RepID=A0A494XBD1_9BACL|nr:threonine synthase [Cohnella endophytica]RKP47322.1 threonine synthase [Cohnella endophytica]